MTLAAERTMFEITTPEGVPLQFPIASVGDRLAAFLIDCVIMGVVTLAFAVVAALAAFVNSSAVMALVNLAIFVLFAFYFTIFEIRWNGVTPGKRFAGIRVIDGSGRSLSSGAIFARNLTRKLEIVIPIAISLNADTFWPGAPSWAILGSLGWLLALLFLPLFNRNRQRAGDFIANTVVVRPPKVTLLRDLASRGESAEAPEYRYAMQPDQLDLYGIYELQTLEKVLRSSGSEQSTLNAIAEKILAKVGWSDRRVHTETFLHEVYAQLRRHLEQKMLFGQRQERKKEGRLDQKSDPTDR